MPETLADLVTKRYGPETPGGAGLPAEGPLAAILDRRTHRRYADRPVPEDMLDLLFACAFSASAKSDLQQASVVRVADPALRAEVAALIPGMPWIGTAPVFMVCAATGGASGASASCAAKPFANDHFDAAFNPAVDTALAMQTFILSAEAMGLGCCPISVVRNHSFRIGELLGLPEWVFPVAGLCIGWPAARGYISMRVPPSVTVHTDRYDDGKLAAGIDAYDRRRDAVYSIPADKQRDTGLYGEAAFYGWSEDKAGRSRTRSARISAPSSAGRAPGWIDGVSCRGRHRARLRQPQLPPLLHRQRRLAGRHLDAAHRRRRACLELTESAFSSA